MRRFLVSSCLADSTQQIHSLRASGVMSFQASRAGELPVKAFRRSAGNWCTVPEGIRPPAMPNATTARSEHDKPSQGPHFTPLATPTRGCSDLALGEVVLYDPTTGGCHPSGRTGERR